MTLGRAHIYREYLDNGYIIKEGFTNPSHGGGRGRGRGRGRGGIRFLENWTPEISPRQIWPLEHSGQQIGHLVKVGFLEKLPKANWAPVNWAPGNFGT